MRVLTNLAAPEQVHRQETHPGYDFEDIFAPVKGIAPGESGLVSKDESNHISMIQTHLPVYRRISLRFNKQHLKMV